MRQAALLLTALVLPACIGGPDEAFPSLLPRPGEAPRAISIQAETPGGLSAEERSLLSDDIARADGRLRQALPPAEGAGVALGAAVRAAGGAPAGDPRWMDAQVARSRLDEARSGLGQSRADLSALLARTDALPVDDPQRAAILAMVSKLDAAEAKVAEQAAAADALLAPPR
jgi:hypothetical protein